MQEYFQMGIQLFGDPVDNDILLLTIEYSYCQVLKKNILYHGDWQPDRAGTSWVPC